jgi:formylglycine-generating enzyme required for sulfatase activity
MLIRSWKPVPVGAVLLAVFAVSVLIAAPAARPAVPAAVPEGMVLVKGGSFQMGNVLEEEGAGDEESPVHKVTLADFYMGKHEVTWGLWKKVYDWAVENGYEFENTGAIGSGAFDRNTGEVLSDPDDPDSPVVPNLVGEHPVMTVSWFDVVKWCNAYSEMEKRTPVYYTGSDHSTVVKTGTPLSKPAFVKWDADGYRLPTEAEWEYAAKGGHLVVGAGKKPPVYAGGDDPDAVAWYDKNSGSRTHPVGTKQANALGIFDMSGNVWEWCYDWYGPYTAVAKLNPHGAETGGGRVGRGGACGRDAGALRAAHRQIGFPGYAHGRFGFRLSRTR